MRILIVTSKKLEGVVKSMIETPEGVEAEVLGLPVDVVALLRPKSLKELIKAEAKSRNIDIRKYDAVIVSGMIPGDLSEVGKELGVKVLKGTKTLSDFKTMMKNIDKLIDKMSPSAPLDEALEEYKIKELAESLRISFEPALEIGSLKVPLRSPPAYLAAEVLDSEDVEGQLHRASEVADMVIIGSTSTSPEPSKVSGLLKLAEKYFKTLGFDSMFPSELKAAREADLLLSLEAGKIEKLKDLKDKAFVVVPGDLSKGYWPTRAEEKLESLITNLRKAEEVGYERLVADPVLSPFPNALESLVALRNASMKINKPLMIGISNYVELIDADSPGVVATLVMTSLEAGVSLVMVTEHSHKCRGAWHEAKVAIMMASSAKVRGTLPKDLGLDLLILKEKKLEREKLEEGELIEASDHDFPLERTVVRIWVDDRVKAKVEPYGVTVTGDPYLIGKTLIAKGFVKSPSHALYLGWELHKAYLAWKLEKSYVQERPLKFEHPREKLEKVKEFLRRDGR